MGKSGSNPHIGSIPPSIHRVLLSDDVEIVGDVGGSQYDSRLVAARKALEAGRSLLFPDTTKGGSIGKAIGVATGAFGFFLVALIFLHIAVTSPKDELASVAVVIVIGLGISGLSAYLFFRAGKLVRRGLAVGAGRWRYGTYLLAQGIVVRTTRGCTFYPRQSILELESERIVDTSRHHYLPVLRVRVNPGDEERFRLECPPTMTTTKFLEVIGWWLDATEMAPQRRAS